MLIPVNQNIDEYKDDFYKGLTLRQSVISLITVAVGAGVYLALTVLLKLPQSLALYLTLPVVFPIAAYGFLKIHGMNIAEYIRKRGAVKERNAYSFVPQMLMDSQGITEEAGMENTGREQEAASALSETKIKDTRKPRIIFLETEESIRDLTEEGKEEMQGR